MAQLDPKECFHSMQRINERDSRCIHCGFVTSATGQSCVYDRRSKGYWEHETHDQEVQGNPRHDRAWAQVEILVQELDREAEIQPEEVRRKIEWDDLPELIPSKESKRKFKPRKPKPREAFNKIFLPEPRLDTTRKHGRAELLEGRKTSDDINVFLPRNKEEFYARQKSLDESEERVQDIYERAGLNKVERDIVKLEALHLNQSEFSDELGISQPAVSMRRARIKVKVKKVDLPQVPSQQNNRDGLVRTLQEAPVRKCERCDTETPTLFRDGEKMVCCGCKYGGMLGEQSVDLYNSPDAEIGDDDL